VVASKAAASEETEANSEAEASVCGKYQSSCIQVAHKWIFLRNEGVGAIDDVMVSVINKGIFLGLHARCNKML
jgi:hypothetical protein